MKTEFVLDKIKQHEDQRALGVKQAILKGKWSSAIAQVLGIACTTTWNVLKKKETTGILNNRY